MDQAPIATALDVVGVTRAIVIVIVGHFVGGVKAGDEVSLGGRSIFFLCHLWPRTGDTWAARS